MNGDWLILEAEAYLSAGQLELASSIVTAMPEQPPKWLVMAKIAIARCEGDDADRLIALGLADQEAEKFNHPAGSPDALFRVLAASRALSNGEPEQSEDFAREAVRRDPTCADARVALDCALKGRSSESDRRALLKDGLRRSPGHPTLVTSLIESLVSDGELEHATDIFEKQKPLLIEHDAQLVSHRIGEFLAIDRLSRLEGRLATEDDAKPWFWIEKVQPPVQEWLRGAHLSLLRGDELAAAYGLYVSKVAEFLLVTKIMAPFRDSLVSPHKLSSNRHRDVARYLSGGYAPSIGGIARLLDAASRRAQNSDDQLTSQFREAVSQGSFGDARVLMSKELIDLLIDLGKARK